MPKTYSNLFEQVYQYDNLYEAYIEARKNKKYREGVLRFSANLEENLIDLQNHLIWQSYKVGEYRKTLIHVPKKRIIMVLPFRDRVLQWAIYRVVAPIFERSYITDSYGCIQGRGNLNAVRRIQYWMRLLSKGGGEVYALSMDVRKYFFRIPHTVIMDALARKIKDPRMMWLFETIICDPNQDFGLQTDVVDLEHAQMVKGVGMPVGSLVSQMIANIILNDLDQYAKRKLRIPYYLRYVDNFAEFGLDKIVLHKHKKLLERFLFDKLGLTLSAANVTRARDGFEFAGYRIWADKLELRKSTTLRMKRRLKHVMSLYYEGLMSMEKARSVLASYRGMMMHCDNPALMEKVHEDFVLTKPFAEDPPV